MLPDPDSLAEILNNYYSNHMALNVANSWCYKRVHEEQFTWPKITKKMLDIVGSVLEQRKQTEFKGFGTPARIG